MKGCLQFMGEVVRITDCFNEITGKHAKYYTLGSLKLIIFHLRLGHRLPQFKGVFEYKYNEFKDTHPEWIVIDTFCRQDKFENNLEKARDAYRAKMAKKAEPVPEAHKPFKGLE